MWLTDLSALGRAASAHISIVCRGSVSADISIPCLLHSSSTVVLPLQPLEIIAGEVSPQTCCCLLRTALLAAGCLPLVCLLAKQQDVFQVAPANHPVLSPWLSTVGKWMWLCCVFATVQESHLFLQPSHYILERIKEHVKISALIEK